MVAPTAGRALAAANAALDWPTEPHLVLWHAQTVLRESRGDGHLAALTSAALDPCEALVAFAADGRARAEALREWRGWSADEWSAAASRLARTGAARRGRADREGRRASRLGGEAD
ncbi:MAG: helix-turn-helix domain-containing protein [Pseudonocardia sp.]